jgi:tetratricopeptide (TPR) repeat protein
MLAFIFSRGSGVEEATGVMPRHRIPETGKIRYPLPHFRPGHTPLLTYNSLRKGHHDMKEQMEARELTAKAQAEESELEKHDYINLLITATNKDPYYPVPYVLLGIHYFKERDMMKAVSNLTRAVELNYILENNEEIAGKAYITLGKIYQMTENKEKSLHYYKTFAGLFPHSGASVKLVKQIYIKNQNIDEWSALFRSGYDAFLAGDYGIALKVFEETLLFHKVFPWTYYYMGRSLIGMGKYDEGISCLKKALELDEHFAFYYAIHEAQEALRDHKEAKHYLEKALSLNPYYHLVLLSAEHHQQRDEGRQHAASQQIPVEKEPDSDYAADTDKQSQVLVDRAEEILGEFQENAEGLFRGVLAEIQIQVSEHMVETKNELLTEAQAAFQKLHHETEDFFAGQVREIQRERELILEQARTGAQDILADVRNDIQTLIEGASEKMRDREEAFLAALQEKVDEALSSARKKAEGTVDDLPSREAEPPQKPSPLPPPDRPALELGKKSRRKK